MNIMMNDLMTMYGSLYIVAGLETKKGKNGRVPDKQTLINSGSAIVFSHIDEHNLIYVFENGYVLYQTDLIGDMVRSTVFPLISVKYSYEFVDDQNVTFNALDLAKEPPENVLTVFGTQKILNNIERSGRMISENAIDDIYKQKFYSVDDFSDQIAEKEEFNQLLKVLYNSIGQLTDLQKKVLSYKFGKRLTQEEIANKMDLTRSTVQSHERSALKKLKKLFEEAGYKVK